MRYNVFVKNVEVNYYKINVYIVHPAGECVLPKLEKRRLFLPSAMHACPRHVPGQHPRTAKSCKGGTRVPDAIIGTYRLRETTPTLNPRSSKVVGVERKASKLASEKSHR
jgi:hypothetical protein